MRRKNSVVIGQRVDPSKLSLAKQFRRDMTPAELTLWKALRNNQIDGLHFRRQQIIAGFIVDFYCHPAHLIIEVDGEVHKSSAKYDQERDRVLESHGFRILRFRNETILTDLSSALAEIRATAEIGLSDAVPPSQ
jgi:very-short-patch-repair endonuclease